MTWMALSVLVLSLPCVVDLSEDFLLRELGRPRRVDYLVIAGAGLEGELQELCRLRAGQGYRVGVARMADVARTFGSIPVFLRHALGAWEQPGPRYLLLAGDTGSVPTVVRPGALQGWLSCPDLATDFDYARPLGGEIALHVGRFPARTPVELRSMARKTLAYENLLPGGDWQRRLVFIAGVGGFGEAIDGMLSSLAEGVIAAVVPPLFDLQVAHADPSSPLCPYPPSFNRHLLERLGEGSLLAMFAGHGSPTSFHDLRWQGRFYPVLRASDADRLAVRQGLPILVSVACHTGAFDGKQDSLGERFVKAERGPVAFIGGSRVTQPYANALFAEAFARTFFGGPATLGEVLSAAKATVTAHRFSLRRALIDAVAAGVQGKENLAKMRRDVVEHYNLLGDPALVIRRPRLTIELSQHENELHVSAPGLDRVELVLEVDRRTVLRGLEPLDPSEADYESKMNQRFLKAHDTVVRRWTVALRGGAGRVPFDPPEQPGRYVLKASGPGGVVGVLVWTVEE